jgi:transposase InsO family protein
MGILALGSISQRNTFIEALATGRRAYWSPRVRNDPVDQGFEIGRKRVARLMREMELFGASPWKFRATTDSDHDHPIAENVLNQNFEALGPNEKRATEISYVWAGETWAA